MGLLDDIHAKTVNYCGTVRTRRKTYEFSRHWNTVGWHEVWIGKTNVNVWPNTHCSAVRGNFCDDNGHAVEPAIVW